MACSSRLKGVPVGLSTLADQVGAGCVVLELILRRMEADVFSAERLHSDDTTVPVLAKGKTDTGRCWVYVRDDRPFGGTDPPAAMFYDSRDRTAEYLSGASRQLCLDYCRDRTALDPRYDGLAMGNIEVGGLVWRFTIQKSIRTVASLPNQRRRSGYLSEIAARVRSRRLEGDSSTSRPSCEAA